MDASVTSKSSFTTETRPKPNRTITVLYFAAASTATGLTFGSIELPTTSSHTQGFPLSELAAFLEARHAGTDLGKILRTSRWSVDAEMVEEGEEDSVILKGGEEVAIICPVSGG